MITRRQFIGSTVATGAVAASLQTAAAVATGLGTTTAFDASPLRLERVIVDGRFAAAETFVQEAESGSVRASIIDGSIHGLWYEDLFYCWRASKRALGGMTDFRALFLLEMMAADAGMRVRHRIHHRELHGAYSHQVFGPFTRRGEIQSRMAMSGGEWARRAARIVMSWPNAATPIDSTHSDVLRAPRAALDGRTLISWLIQ